MPIRKFVDQYIKRERKPAKFETKVQNFKFSRDKDGKLIVVENGMTDWVQEAQSHAKEVGFENIVKRLPDGRVVISSNTSSGVGFYGDATVISDEPNQAQKDLAAIRSRAVAANKELNEKFGERDYLNISRDDLNKLITDYMARQASISEVKKDE